MTDSGRAGGRGTTATAAAAAAAAATTTTTDTHAHTRTHARDHTRKHTHKHTKVVFTRVRVLSHSIPLPTEDTSCRQRRRRTGLLRLQRVQDSVAG